MNYLRFSLSLRSHIRGSPRFLIRHNSVAQKQLAEKVKFIGRPLQSVMVGNTKIPLNKAQSFEVEQNKLIEKHELSLFKKPGTLYEVIDKVESFMNSNYFTMRDMLHYLKDSKTDLTLLSDRQMSIIFKISGELNIKNCSKVRDSFTDKFFSLFQEKNVKFGIMGLNSYFETKLYNGNPISVTKFYELLSKYEVEPNIETFEILAENCAKNSDAKGVLDIIKIMKEVDLPATTKIFAALVEALVASDNVEKARNFILGFEKKKNAINMQTIRISFMKGLASSNKFEAFLKEMEEFNRIYISTEIPNFVLLFEPLILFAKSSNNIEHVKKIISIFATVDSELLNKFKNDVGRFYTRCLDFIYDGNILMAKFLFNILPQKYKSETDELIVKTFLEKIAQENDVQKIEREADLLREYNIIENPLLLSFSQFNKTNHKKFIELFQIFKNSKEYQLFKDRYYIIKADLFCLNAQLKVENCKENQIEIIKKMLSLANVTKEENNRRKINNVIFYLISNFMQKNIDLLEKLLKDSTKNNFKVVAVKIINNLFYAKNFEKLKKVVDIVRKNNVTIPINRKILSDINTILNNVSSSPIEISICCSILSCCFNIKTNYFSKNNTLDIVTNVLKNAHLSDASVLSMINQWADEGTILLTKSEVDDISNQLTSIGLISRIPYLEKILQKSNTVLRWLGTNDIMKLESELMFLQTLPKRENKSDISVFLRTIIVSKHLQQPQKNFEAIIEHLEKIFETNDKNLISRVEDVPTKAMRILVRENQSKFADNLWNIKNIIIDTDAALIYAFNLYLRNEIDKMDCVFDEIKSQVNTLNDKTLVLMSEYLSNATLKQMDDFSNLLQKNFHIDSKGINAFHITKLKKNFKNLLNEDKLNDAFDTAKQILSISSSTFGQIELMCKAIQTSNSKVFKDVINWVKDNNDPYAAYIDASIALLENGKHEVAKKTLENVPHIMISQRKLGFIINREVALGNVDVLKFVLNFVCDKDWSSDEMVNSILSAILNIYESQNLLSEITKFKETLDKMNFPFSVKANLMFQKYF
ncbi:Hypothetical protein SRAE_1000037200 [Strongyloides ratti]|uniref:Leucine-rich PPR motif-containing protein, mitochondrial n=1 Tax=Strongyloides ratti TaxID=34506 RepID=A0A090MUA1_STRRB|nr:Hypothetical protein SRAE_1000037200 [Strongyloides ratti]CEF62098.1 Hypothetical protein SRAE_1000037200 [Strongyloides ratti]